MDIAKGLYSIGYLDSLAYKDTPIHRVDPRVKIVTTLFFLVTVVSMPAYQISGLMPFFLYPVFLIVIGDIPLGFLFKKLLIVSPFVLMVALFNPLFDKTPVLVIKGITITGGWLSFISIITKFVLTIGTAVLLVATTSFNGICEGLSAMRLPRVFVTQLMLLYRYIFVLIEEALRMVRARDSRAPVKRAKSIGVFVQLVGVLLVRTISRAERVYAAMLSRGFSGEFPGGRVHGLRAGDLVFLISWAVLFILMRRYNIPVIIGSLFGRL
ncbi:MAG: cobalt ECF transporter T component CbiQ [Nitrospirae bacterium]|nr:MAG: cobalt ECF transporter T component CbiQ [Nitrospirota bacterium]